MSEQNKQVVRRAYQTIAEGMRQGNLDAVDEFVDENVRDHNPDSGQGPGRQGIKDWFLQLAAGFPDIDIEIQDLVAEGDKVAARVKFTGTHTGAFQGIPPTGKRSSIDVVDFLRLENGKLVERWGVADQMAMLQQLGIMQDPASNPESAVGPAAAF